MPFVADTTPKISGSFVPDAPRGGFVPDSPYAEIIQESRDFNRRAAANTPEAIGRSVALTDADIDAATTIPIYGMDVPVSRVKPLIANAPRIMAPLGAAMSLTGVGTIPGALMIGGAGALGEIGSEYLEKEMGDRESYSLPQIGTNTLMSAIPGARLTGIGNPLARAALRTGEGAVLGAAQPAVQAGLEGRLPEISEMAEGAKFGAILGAPFGAAELGAARRSQVLQRIEGKPLEQQKAILAQEMKLGADIDSPQLKREGLELQQSIDTQLEQQRLQETQIKEQEKAMADAQKAQQDQLAQIQEPPEVPKSTQILQESAKPPVLANVATEVGTQTSPFALQGKLNEITAAPAQAVDPALAEPALQGIDELTPRQRAAAIRAQNAGVAGAKFKAPMAEPEAVTVAPFEAPEPTPAELKAADIAKAVENPDTQFQYTVQQGEEGFPGYVQVDAILPSAPEAQSRNTVSSSVKDLNKAGAKLPDVPDWVPTGQYMREDLEALIKAGPPKPNADLESAANQAIDSLSESKLTALADQLGINTMGFSGERLRSRIISNAPREDILGAIANPVAMPAKTKSQRGAISAGVLAPIAGSGAGAAYGITQGDSPEERVRNAALYGALGLGAGALTGQLANKAFAKPIRSYSSPELKKVAQMLTPIEEKTSLFEKLGNAASNFRYRFNTRFAPIGDAQRTLYKQAGLEFTPNRYYDLERGLERLSGAPVQAEGEVELLQQVIDKLPKESVPHLDTYLTLSRIEDRLLKTGEENNVLMDAVGRAQAELDLAKQANAANPGVMNSGRVYRAAETLSAANKKLNEGFDRKRVADWSVNDARKGLSDLEQAVGPAAFAQLKQAGQEYQDVMTRSLQIQVDSGRMKQDLMDAIKATNDFYAPFKVLKYFDDEEGFVKGGGMSRIPSSAQLAKKITGIDDLDVRIGSPTNVAAEQVYKGYILAQKNKKIQDIAKLASIDPQGDYVAPLAPGIEPRKGYERVSYFEKGEPRALEVSRPIADALNGLDEKELSLILKGMSGFSNVFKLGATGASIPFNLSNALVFDPLRLATISRYGFRGPQDLLYTLYEWPKALFSSARGNIGQALGATPGDLYDTWIKSGAANSTLARVMTPEAFGGRQPRNQKTGEILVENNFGLGAPLKVASLISNTLEETTKLLGLQRAMRLEKLDTLTPQQLEQKWPEIVNELRNYAGSPDFSRAGVDMKPLNIVMPFLNPRWQGFNADMARLNPFRQGNAKDAAAAWARLGSIVGLPAAGLAVYNLSTPENARDFEQIPKTERERYFHIPLQVGPDGKPTILGTGQGYYFKNKDGVDIRGYYRIPKREFPGLMANTIEDFVEYAKGQGEETFSQVAANFMENAAQTASPVNIEGDNIEERALSAASGLNPVARVPLETALNKNLFTGREIVPRGREKASPELQYGPNTPESYKTAASFVPDYAPESLQSPAKLQHVVEGFTGGFSRQFAAPSLSEGNPAGDSSPLLGRFYRSERIESSDLLNSADAAERARAALVKGGQ